MSMRNLFERSRTDKFVINYTDDKVEIKLGGGLIDDTLRRGPNKDYL